MDGWGEDDGEGEEECWAVWESGMGREYWEWIKRVYLYIRSLGSRL